jgi:hypothetical protein
MPFERETVGEPYTGNPYVRFDEGVLNAARANIVCGSRVRRNIRSCVSGIISTLLYRLCGEKCFYFLIQRGTLNVEFG